MLYQSDTLVRDDKRVSDSGIEEILQYQGIVRSKDCD
jgi:hypothetical protein